MRLIEYTPKKWAEFVKARTPLLESLVPLKANGSRNWMSMGDDTLVAHSRWKISDEKINGRNNLYKTDSGMYFALRGRNLLDEAGLPNTQKGYRKWIGMDEEEIVAFAIRFVGENEIASRRMLVKADSGLYKVLRKRKLLDAVGLRQKHRDWAGMTKDELIASGKGFIEEGGILGRGELNKANSRLYDALRKRKLLDEVGLPDSNEGDRNWAGMGKDKLLAHAKAFIAERGITGRRELERADLGLYKVLKKGKLLDEVGLEERYRDWAGMKRDELVAHAKGFIAERGITGRKELRKADSGLYDALRWRNLLDEVGLEAKHRDWAGMEKDEMVVYAKAFIAERGITGRKELRKADSWLYKVLKKRKLLDAVFSDVESSNHKEAVDGVLDALDSFGDDG